MIPSRWPTWCLGALCSVTLALAAGYGSSARSSASSTKAAGTAKTINYAMNSFSDDRASTALATAVLKKAGYDVKQEFLGSVGIDFAAIASGDADVYSDAWLPHTHALYWSRYRSKLITISKLYLEPVTTGLVVPDYCPTQTIGQLNQNPAMYGGNIIGIEAGAGEMATTQRAISAYGLHVTLVSGSEAAMLASLKAALIRHQCVVVTLWRPHPAFVLYPIRYLKDPKGIYGSDYAWTAANRSFPKEFPHAYAFFQHFTIHLKDQESMINGEVNKGETPATAAAAWMAAHPTTVNRWVSIARGK